MAVAHAEVPLQDGSVVWTHKYCASAVRQWVKPITAQPKEKL